METQEPTLDRARFARTWQRLGGTGNQAFEAVVASYGARFERAYHNLSHILDCLAWFDQAAHLAEHPDEVELALIFHDAIYEPLARDNEARSAELFARLANEAGVARDAITCVERLIRSTANHEGNSADEALTSDIDLAILGAEAAAFSRFERGIRAEYRAVDEATYRKGRRRVLLGFLARDFIYKTSFFRSRLELRARENLARALATL